jgi:hypothetical protein
VDIKEAVEVAVDVVEEILAGVGASARCSARSAKGREADIEADRTPGGNDCVCALPKPSRILAGGKASLFSFSFSFSFSSEY